MALAINGGTLQFAGMRHFTISTRECRLQNLHAFIHIVLSGNVTRCAFCGGKV